MGNSAGYEWELLIPSSKLRQAARTRLLLLSAVCAVLVVCLALCVLLLLLRPLSLQAYVCEQPRSHKTVHAPMQELLMRTLTTAAAAAWYEGGGAVLRQCEPIAAAAAPLDASTAASPPPSVAVVMVDTRSYSTLLQRFLLPDAVSDSQWTDSDPAAFVPRGASAGADYRVSLTVALNAMYVTEVQHDLLFYELTQQQDDSRLRAGGRMNESDTSQTAGKQNPACFHATEGWRSAPWCKLLAIAHAMSIRATSRAAAQQQQQWAGVERMGGAVYTPLSAAAGTAGPLCDANSSFSSSAADCPLYEYVLFVDSDASIVSSLPLHELAEDLIRGGPGDESGQAELFFPRDGPFQPDVPNSGLLWLRNTKRARRFLRLWWDAHLPFFNQRNTYEQHPLWPTELGGLNLFQQQQSELGLAYMRQLEPVQTELWNECVGYSDPRRNYLMGHDWGDECSYAARLQSPIVHFAHIFREDMENGFTTELLIQLRRRMGAVDAYKRRRQQQQRSVQQVDGAASKSSEPCLDSKALLIDPRRFRHFRMDGFSFQMPADAV